MWISKDDLNKRIISERADAIRIDEENRKLINSKYEVVVNYGVTDPSGGKLTEIGRKFSFDTIEEAQACIAVIGKADNLDTPNKFFSIDFASPCEWVYTGAWIEKDGIEI